MTLRRNPFWHLLCSLLVAAAGSNLAMAAGQVVVYTSVDQEFSEPVLKRFERETGIQVKAVYDAEAAKTVGLERRLLAERRRPKADIFWNSEYLRTLRLTAERLFTSNHGAYDSLIPTSFRSPSGHWAGFGGRARIFLVNTQLV